jgi:hypothetical protein
LHWSNAAGSVINSLTDLIVTKFDGTTWKDIGNVGTTGGVGVGVAGTVKSNLVNSFSPFTFANKTLGVNLLPIELIAFEAKANDNDEVDLTWVTASERGSDYFIVERSLDGKLFEEVNQVKAAGNSSNNLSYTSIDSKPYEGLSYYRLQLVDKNGSTKLSQVVSVVINTKETSLVAYPNPFDGNTFFLSGMGLSLSEHQITIADAVGKTVYSSKITPVNSSLNITIEMPAKLQAGIYFVTVADDITQYNFKLIVK